jgi:hypothetical protein
VSISANVADRLIGGRYEPRLRIGAGGMAEVYLARDRRLERDIALKVLGPRLAGDQAFAARFRREAQAAAALNHPNVVAVYDCGVDGDVHFIAMEHVEGPDLKRLLAERGPLPEDEALAVAAQVAAALEAAHARGMVHRDVKPHNLLLDARGVVKVADFGIARALGAGDQTTAVLGSPAYLAPEQALGRAVDGRADLYGLGVVLFELLAGHPPFAGDSPAAVAAQHAHAPPPPLRSVAPTASPAVEAIVRRALAKDPGERFQTAGEMAAAIAAARSADATAAIADAAPHGALPAARSGRALPRRSLLAAALLLPPLAVALAARVRGGGAGPAPGATAVGTVAATAPPAPTSPPAPTAVASPTPAATATAAASPTPAATATPPPPSATPSPRPPTATSVPARPAPAARPPTNGDEDDEGRRPRTKGNQRSKDR